MPDQVLTPRQLQVLLLRADGVNRESIAARLGVQPQTVRVHQQKALRSLGARNCAHAMLLIGRMGLLGEVS